MTSCLRFVNGNRSLALLLALCLVAGGSGFAAEAPTAGEGSSIATRQPVDELMELGEVWVRGKTVTRLIEDAEDAFFARYNMVNKDDDYDVHCGDIALSRGSMIMTRTCLPGFLADRLAPRAFVASSMYYQPPAASFSSPQTCYGPMTVDGGNAHYEGGCFGVPADQRFYGGRGYSSTSYMPIMQGPQQYAPPLELEAFHRREEYADNIKKVILGDPQLVAMATDLTLLYEELELTQRRYQAARKARFEELPRNYGPRVPAPSKR